MSTPDDPRARWLITALHRLYQELDPGAVPFAVSVTVESAGQLITYGFDGSDQITRLITTADDAAAAADAGRLEALATGLVIDATVRDGPP